MSMSVDLGRIHHMFFPLDKKVIIILKTLIRWVKWFACIYIQRHLKRNRNDKKTFWHQFILSASPCVALEASLAYTSHCITGCCFPPITGLGRWVIYERPHTFCLCPLTCLNHKSAIQGYRAGVHSNGCLYVVDERQWKLWLHTAKNRRKLLCIWYLSGLFGFASQHIGYITRTTAHSWSTYYM